MRSNSPPRHLQPTQISAFSKPRTHLVNVQNHRASIFNLISMSSPITAKYPVVDFANNSEFSFQFPYPMKPKLGFLVLVLVWVSVFWSESKCSKGCGLALASYYVWEGSNLTFIADVLQSDLNITPDTIVSYNKQKIPNKDFTDKNIRINVPFSCNCIDGEYLGYVFDYTAIAGDTYTTVAQTYYANLTTPQSVETNNSVDANNIPLNTRLNVPVTCSCGSSSVSREYGLFMTYPLRLDDTLESVAAETGLNATLLQSYNPGVNFSRGSGVVYIPGKGDKFRYAFELMKFLCRYASCGFVRFVRIATSR